MDKKQTAYEQAEEATKAAADEKEQKRNAMKGDFLGKIETEDAYKVLVEFLKNADLDIIKDCLELVSGAIIEEETEETHANYMYFDVFNTRDYMDFFEGKLSYADLYEDRTEE